MKVLLVAAHPDDEILGAGATLAKHVISGDEVRILILGSGAEARIGATAADAVALREAARCAAEIVGATATVGTLPDNRFDSVDLLDVVRIVEMVVREFGPEVVYTHCPADLSIDHRVTHQAVLAACRPQNGCTVRRVLAFEVPSSTEWGFRPFAPTVFVDVSGQAMEKKNRALDCYTAELRRFPHPRSVRNIDALATLRGATAGVFVAEAFELVREIA